MDFIFFSRPLRQFAFYPTPFLVASLTFEQQFINKAPRSQRVAYPFAEATLFRSLTLIPATMMNVQYKLLISELIKEALCLSEAYLASGRLILFINSHIKRFILYVLHRSRRLNFATK